MVATWYLRGIASSQSACFSGLRAYYANSGFREYLIKNQFLQSYKLHFNNILCEIQLSPLLLSDAITDTSCKST